MKYYCQNLVGVDKNSKIERKLYLNSDNGKKFHYQKFYFDKKCVRLQKDFWPIFIKPFWPIFIKSFCSSSLVFGLAVTWHAIKLNYKIWFDSHESESFYFSDCTFVLLCIGNINQGFRDLRDTDHACMLYSAPPSPIVQYTCRNICMIWASVGEKYTIIGHKSPQTKSNYQRRMALYYCQQGCRKVWKSGGGAIVMWWA